ncbi:hypothetical protein CKY51_01065 [Xanthomonas maliensis]|nr:hypothetical protein CKY51_01065 [Xanthomonas maliensis]
MNSERRTVCSALARLQTAVMERQFKPLLSVDTAMRMERTNDGRRVRQSVVDVWQDGTWAPLATAQAIGRMKIDHFAPVTASRMRLNIPSSFAAVHLRNCSCSMPATALPRADRHPPSRSAGRGGGGSIVWAMCAVGRSRTLPSIPVSALIDARRAPRSRQAAS